MENAIPNPTVMEDIGPQTLDLTPVFRKKISRLFIFRGLRAFLFIIPFYVWAMWISLISFLHFWYKLILGRRHEGFWKREVRFLQYVTRWSAYMNGIIDTRPKVIGDVEQSK